MARTARIVSAHIPHHVTQRGNILTDTRKFGGKSYEIFYAYDLADRIVGMTYSDGREVALLAALAFVA